MERTSTIEHKGKQIIFMNVVNLNHDETIVVFDEAAAVIRTKPPRSVRILVDYTGTGFDNEVVNKVKEFIKDNEPYVIASAVIGMTEIQKSIFQTVVIFSKRNNIRVIDKMEDAKEWLVEQE